MAMAPQLETLALAALARLGDDAYAVTIHDEIERLTRRPVALAGIYSALDRMERAGLVRARMSDPLPERGGRSRRHYDLTAAGRRQMARERDLAARMWTAVPAAASPSKVRQR